MIAVTVETMKAVALGIVGVLVLFAIISAKVMASITQKVLSLVVLAALAAAVWSQRTSLTDCANEVKASATTAASTRTPTGATCTFFGYEVDVSLPRR